MQIEFVVRMVNDDEAKLERFEVPDEGFAELMETRFFHIDTESDIDWVDQATGEVELCGYYVLRPYWEDGLDGSFFCQAAWDDRPY